MKSASLWLLSLVAFMAAWWLGGVAHFTKRPPTEPRTVVTLLDLSKGEPHGALGRRIRSVDAGFQEARAAGAADGWYVATFDNMSNPQSSPHRVLVDGVPLAKPHAMHAWIESNPSGFSFWGDAPGEGWLYVSLPTPPPNAGGLALGGADTRVEVEWHLVKSWTTGELVRASLASLLALGCGLLGLRLAPKRSLAAPCALLALLMLGSAVCVTPAILWLESAAEVRQASMLARHVAYAVIATVALVGLAAALLRRRGPGAVVDTPFESALRRATAAPFVFVMTLAALLLVVLSMRAGAGSETLYATGNVGGFAAAARLPFADAGGWFNQSLGLAMGHEVDWGARRPLHALERAGQFAILGGSFDGAALVQVLMLTLAVTAFTISVARALSPLAGVIAWVVVTLTAEGVAPSFLSEAVGLTVACSAAALFVRGLSEGSFAPRAAGGGLLSIALAIRPGPMFLLAVPVILEFLRREPRRPLRSVAMVAFVLAGPLLASAVFSRVAAPFTIQNANAAHVLYGLAHGTNWFEGEKMFFAEDPARRDMAEKDFAPLMVELAWKKFREDPWPALSKLSANGRAGLEAIGRDIPGALLWPFGDIAAGWPRIVFAIALGLLVAIGVAQQLKRASLLALLPILALLAVAASLPMIWGDARWRGLVVALPFLALTLAFAAVARNPWRAVVERLPPAPVLSRVERAFLLAPAVAVLALMVVGLVVFESRRASASTGRIVSLTDSAAVFVVEHAPLVSPLGVPELARNDFLAGMKRTIDRRPDGFAWLREAEVPFLLTVHSPAEPAFVVPGDSAFWTVVPGLAPEMIPSGKRAIRILETGPTPSNLIKTATKWEYVE
jgi:hypothetical protein